MMMERFITRWLSGSVTVVQSSVRCSALVRWHHFASNCATLDSHWVIVGAVARCIASHRKHVFCIYQRDNHALGLFIGMSLLAKPLNRVARYKSGSTILVHVVHRIQNSNRDKSHRDSKTRRDGWL